MKGEAKELIVEPVVEGIGLAGFLDDLHREGVKSLITDPRKLKGMRRTGFTVYHGSQEADIILTEGLQGTEALKAKGKPFACRLRIASNTDIRHAREASKLGAKAVLVDAVDWKIIPLENLVAELHTLRTKLFATAASAREVRTLLGVLELGVDGVVLRAARIEDVREAAKAFASGKTVEIVPVKVRELRDLDMGERACIDTASMLTYGEGLLVGSKSNFLFLLHNESGGSKFTSPRPFRVNAGAVHSYTLLFNGKTKYLSEVEAGDEVLVVSKEGEARSVVVGRSKIERRPLKLVRAEFDGEVGTILVQNAETIAFVGKGGDPIPVTELKEEDEVLARVVKAKGRHFGIEVDEYILEK